ncbi:MAG TPA: 6-phosphogluconolactonase [Candidatus Aquilonibacter sp.]|nr:6-phosphogluconolactonase [Candidatus Aquilonibacter sp.]
MSERPGELRVYDSPADVARALAELFVRTGTESIVARGTFTVALAGGSTPKAAYALLGAEYADALDWGNVDIFFGDERCVPPDDDLSNYKTADDAFLSHIDIPSENVHRMHGEMDPADAAAEYRRDVIEVLGPDPRFDLIMLGMGPDGHTASLFPGTDPTTDDDALVRAVYSSSQQQWRITLTPKVINNARCVVFATEGAAKRAMLKRVREGTYDPVQTPAQIVAPHDGALIWLVDSAAVTNES